MENGLAINRIPANTLQGNFRIDRYHYRVGSLQDQN